MATHTARQPQGEYVRLVQQQCCQVVTFKISLLLGYPQESKIDMSELQLTADQLAEMVSLIEDGTISGKIAKQILPDLLQVGLSCCKQLLRKTNVLPNVQHGNFCAVAELVCQAWQQTKIGFTKRMHA